MTLFQITFVSVPIRSSFTAWREKALVKVYVIDFSVLVTLHVLALIGYNGTFSASTSLASSVWWRVGGGMHSQICTRQVLIRRWILQLYQSSTACHTIPFQ